MVRTLIMGASGDINRQHGSDHVLRPPRRRIQIDSSDRPVIEFKVRAQRSLVLCRDFVQRIKVRE